ncbi:MAG: hypothetical protein PVJ11_16005 [Syntrophobacterales bacterium]|jgi:hypothetical protein
MTQNTAAADAKTFAISVTGVRAGYAQEDLVAALQRIFPRQTTEQIRGALAKLPFLLTRAATEEQAKKIKNFLESRGAVLKFVASSAAAVTAPQTADAPAHARPAAAQATPAPQEEKPYTGVERRAKPRAHPGLEIYPMGVGEILDRSFRLLRQHFLLFFIILMIPQVTFFLINKGMEVYAKGGIQQGMSTGMVVGIIFSVLFAVVIMMILQFWAQGALIYAVSETYLGHETSIGRSYGAMRSRLWRLLSTMFLMGFFIILPPVLMGVVAAIFIPPLTRMGYSGSTTGILFVVLWIAGAAWFLHLLLNWLLVDKVVVLEGEGWRSALRRSKELMKTRTEPGFWKRPKNKAALILFLGFLIGIGIHLLFQTPGLIMHWLMPSTIMGQTIQEILNVVATSLATVFTAIAMILFYYDIRLRSEGFDLKMMAKHL